MDNKNWMNNPKLKNIDKSKLQLFMSLADQSEGKAPKDLMPFILAAASKTKGNGFSPEETDAIIEVLQQGKSPAEIKNIEKIRSMMKLMK